MTEDHINRLEHASVTLLADHPLVREALRAALDENEKLRAFVWDVIALGEACSWEVQSDSRGMVLARAREVLE